MLSILCVRFTINVKVRIPESFKVGWYPPKELGRVTLTVFPACNSWLNYCVRGQFEIKIFYFAAQKHNIFHMNERKIKLEPAIICKLVTCQRITSKILDLDGSTPEPAIRSSDTGQRIPCFDSCQLITTLMSNMCALSVFPCSQTS